MKVKALILFLALAGMQPLAAQAQIYYAISDNTAYVLHCTPSASGNIVIASNYDGYPVTGIGNYAFEDCYGLASVTIPESVTDIGTNAFYACIGLMSIVIPNSVTNIGWEPFFGCSALTNIVTGNGITSIGRAEFYNCYNLANITIGTNVTNIGAGAFVGCTNLTSIIIPNSVTTIDEGAFQNCFNLTNVTFLGNPPTLGSYVFSGDNHVTAYYYYGASGWSWSYYGFRTAMLGVVPFTYFTNNGTIIITSYTGTNTAMTIGPVINGFPVTDIDFNDFTAPQECTNLTSITIPASVTGIGSDAFYGCINLTNITFLGNAPALRSDVFDGDLATVYYYYGASGWGTNYGGLPVVELDVPFTYTTNNDAITITGYIGTNNALTIAAAINGYLITNIGGGAFAGSPLTSIAISANITNIDDKAFQNCASLTNITFLGNAPALGDDVFSNDSAIAYFYYGTGGWNAFYDGLMVVELFPFTFTTNNDAITVTGYTGPSSAVKIPAAFNGYPVTSIGNYAFWGSSLTSVIIPDSVTSIGDNAFLDCGSLTNITIPNSVTTIGESAFEWSGLMNVTIPDSVTSIGIGVFYNCTGLKNVVIPNSITNIGDAAFGGCTSLANIVIPDSVTGIGDYMFNNCNSLMSITIPDSVTSIGDDAFYGCGLTHITIPNSITNIGDEAFAYCYFLTNLTFLGNAPNVAGDVFYESYSGSGLIPGPVYYYYGTTGWGATYGGLPTVELAWTPQIVGGAKMQSDSFDFTIIGTNGMPLVVEASTNLVDWQPIWTNSLSGASTTFADSQWTNYPARFYRAR